VDCVTYSFVIPGTKLGYGIRFKRPAKPGEISLGSVLGGGSVGWGITQGSASFSFEKKELSGKNERVLELRDRHQFHCGLK